MMPGAAAPANFARPAQRALPIPTFQVPIAQNHALYFGPIRVYSDGMNQEMRDWLEAKSRWVSWLFWLALGLLAVAIVLVSMFLVWFVFVFEPH